MLPGANRFEAGVEIGGYKIAERTGGDVEIRGSEEMHRLAKELR
jgi:hypothetical protein